MTDFWGYTFDAPSDQPVTFIFFTLFFLFNLIFFNPFPFTYKYNPYAYNDEKKCM